MPTDAIDPSCHPLLRRLTHKAATITNLPGELSITPDILDHILRVCLKAGLIEIFYWYPGKTAYHDQWGNAYNFPARGLHAATELSQATHVRLSSDGMVWKSEHAPSTPGKSVAGEDAVRVALREAIARVGNEKKPDDILRAAGVNDSDGRRILRELEASGEYKGYGRAKPKRSD